MARDLGSSPGEFYHAAMGDGPKRLLQRCHSPNESEPSLLFSHNTVGLTFIPLSLINLVPCLSQSFSFSLSLLIVSVTICKHSFQTVYRPIPLLFHLQREPQFSYESRAKYWTTISAFYDFCVTNRLPWHTSSLADWLPKEALKYPGRILTQRTMEQKCSHVNFLADFNPPVKQGYQYTQREFYKALGSCVLRLTQTRF